AGAKPGTVALTVAGDGEQQTDIGDRHAGNAPRAEHRASRIAAAPARILPRAVPESKRAKRRWRPKDRGMHATGARIPRWREAVVNVPRIFGHRPPLARETQNRMRTPAR